MPETIVHFITDTLSIFVGVYLYTHSKVIDTLNENKRLILIVGALIGALLGSRLLAALENPELFINPPSLLYYYSGKTIIGGIAGGILGIEVAKRILGIQVWTGDRALVPLAIAIIIGRIGCFVLGVTDGTVGGACNYFWCLEQGDGILRHPNSLYEIGFVLIFILVYTIIKRAQPISLLTILNTPGASFRVFIVLYFLLRFGIEFLKDTHPLFLNLNSIQIVCTGFILWYLMDLIRIHTTRKTT